MHILGTRQEQEGGGGVGAVRMSVWVGGGPSPLDEMSLVPPYDAMGGYGLES